MAERLHPGVYVEERRGGLAPIQGVSTSNMGIVGFTPWGPSDEAVLITSYTQFKDELGDFTADSQVPTHVFAFFANGGRRAYVVRVTGSGSAKASGTIKSDTIETALDGDGTVGPLAGTLTHPPLYTVVAGGTVSFTYKIAGAALVAQVTNALPTPDGIALSFAGQLPSLPVPGTVIINTTIAGPAIVTYDDSGAVAGTNGDGVLRETVGGVAYGAIDYKTGKWTLTALLANVPAAASSITADYTAVGASRTVTDNGAGVLTGTGVAAGTIGYTDGTWSITWGLVADAPHNHCPIIATYSQIVWAFQAISEGVWGNDIRVDVRGDEDYWTRASAAYSRYDMLVYKNDGTSYVLDETFEDLSFTDPTDPRYVGSVLNNDGLGSDLIDLIEPANEDVGPRSLSGYARSQAVGMGNGARGEFGTAGSGLVFTAPWLMPVLEAPVQPGSVVITYMDVAGTARTITDDGDGNLIGDVDPAAAAGYNQIDYDTGDFAIKTGTGLAAVSVGSYGQAGVASIMVAAYYMEPIETTQQDVPTGGLDGAALTRNELTDPALLADREGMYALLTTNELINLTIPDAAGDVTMSLDQTTECERNEKWFAILATPPGYTPQQAKDWRLNKLGYVGNYAALYYPYITITDPVTDLPVNVPPGGHIAGVYARTDANKNVGKAPAGVEDGRLNFCVGLERTLEFAEIDILHPNQVNALIDTPMTGRCVWGARTLERPSGDFRYVHVRRLFNFLKLSIFNSTHGFVFENVGASLRARIKLSIESFLMTLFSQGMFAGTSPAEAFVVVCDETNNPPEVEDTGTVICDIYVAPNKPGEFIVFRIQQKYSASE